MKTTDFSELFFLLGSLSNDLFSLEKTIDCGTYLIE